MDNKTGQQGYEAAIRLLQEELRRHYGCKTDPCKDDHDFDEYGDAIASAVMSIRRLMKNQGSAPEVLEHFQ